MNLEDLREKNILLLGKSRAFGADEFEAQLRAHSIGITKSTEDMFALIVEGRMMTPYEQNVSDALYEKGGSAFLDIDSFEKMLAAKIDDNVLLMSLKLSNDKARLKNFLQNSCISDELFFKLLSMYNWSGEDFFENDDNRDVSAALIGRFYENIERNHNVQYATTGIIHLISQTSNEQLLEAISSLEPLKFHPKISVLLAQHPKTSKFVLKKLLKNGNAQVLEAMSSNVNLDKAIAQELLKDDAYAKNIARNIALDAEMFTELRPFSKALADNTSLTKAMQKELFELGDDEVNLSLAQNPSLSNDIAEILLAMNDESLTQELYANEALREELLREAFQEHKNHSALSRNPAMPQELLEELFALGESEVLENLARNESTPIEVLYQLQLDRRFERAVKTNKAFGKHVQSENIGWL
ncbi:hypothetical protein [Sulfurimonas paralvinellae]|uniref:Leucine rich repeat variant n=1 Tax=Sulfurimonas paralvinellae TaxID=317658 RepID=A0A7M1B5R9_9BACT|nr:hypothetical protein [Sulfurimonas paralvinellae]QOP45087.1 hypothetical protein FM071_01765 [Sulfurimonas paralvinellae]